MGSVDNAPAFTIKDVPVENQRPLKVRVIGAGYCGIYLGIRIPQRLRNIDLRIYEKNQGVGGTWWVNRYPGCACDIPAHSYQYSFHPNPDWSAFYAPQAEICAYLTNVAHKFGVMRFVKLQHEVESCRWDESAKLWRLRIRDLETGELFDDDANVVVSARGNLSDPAWPDVPGLRNFGGEIMHSARWKEGYDFRDRKIGIIGNGSSAIQIVPSLQKVEGTQLSCFVRSKTWITNPFGDVVMQKLGLDPTKLEFSEAQRATFAADPDTLHAFRKTIEVDGNTIHDLSFRDTPTQRQAVQHTRDAMRARLQARPEIADFLTPTFAVGCRRLTPGPGYLEALVEPNVEFVTGAIVRVERDGVVVVDGPPAAVVERTETETETQTLEAEAEAEAAGQGSEKEEGQARNDDHDGTVRERKVGLDVLVCATGFNASGAPPFEIAGLRGTTLRERFADSHPEAYLSLAVDGFPNLFMMLGPNSAIGSGSLTMILETEGDYIVKCIRKLQKEDYASMVVKPERVRDWAEYCRKYFERTVYTDECNSWYKSERGKGNTVTGLWPGSTLHALEALRAPRWEDFDYEGIVGSGNNRMGWLGNGWSLTHTREEGAGPDEFQGDPAWYLENRFQSVPVVGQPEQDDEFRLRPFSH